MFKRIIGVIFFLSLGVGIWGCVTSKSNMTIMGNWSETWGAGEETNVNYSDVYVIQKKSGNDVKITCPKRNNYIFENINFDGKKLTFRLIIKDLKYGTEDAWVDYALELQANKLTFQGSALTKAGVKAKIIWAKLQI